MLIVGGNWNNGANAGVRRRERQQLAGQRQHEHRVSAFVCYPSPGDYGRRPVYCHTTKVLARGPNIQYADDSQ